MGSYINQPDYITSAVAVTKSNTIDVANNLDGSTLYVGGLGNVAVILAGKTYDLTITTPSSTITTDGEFIFDVEGSAGVSTSGSGGAAKIKLTVAGGIVTATEIINPGRGFALADTITFTSTALPGAAVSCVLTLATTSGVIFTNIASGTIMPVVCDYLLSTGTTATAILALK